MAVGAANHQGSRGGDVFHEELLAALHAASRHGLAVTNLREGLANSGELGMLREQCGWKFIVHRGVQGSA